MIALGRCSLCGGTVVVPLAWYGTTVPVPRCDCCGATLRVQPLPVLKTERPAGPWAPRAVA